MSADDLNKQQTRDGDAVDDNAVDDNVGSTPTANVTVVNLNTAAFEGVQKMFSNFEKKSEERDKIMSSLAKQQEPGPSFHAGQPESVEEDSISRLL